MTAAPARALSATAFATLLLIALMMGANHVAARIAFNNGVDVATAVVVRSSITALVIVAILAAQRMRVVPRHGTLTPANRVPQLGHADAKLIATKPGHRGGNGCHHEEATYLNFRSRSMTFARDAVMQSTVVRPRKWGPACPCPHAMR